MSCATKQQVQQQNHGNQLTLHHSFKSSKQHHDEEHTCITRDSSALLAAEANLLMKCIGTSDDNIEKMLKFQIRIMVMFKRQKGHLMPHTT
eukprot:15365999-Ditylum_brightwellii.AAC.1